MQEEQLAERPTWTTPKLKLLVALDDAKAGKDGGFVTELSSATFSVSGHHYNGFGPAS